jgi:hypothetical protein
VSVRAAAPLSPRFTSLDKTVVNRHGARRRASLSEHAVDAERIIKLSVTAVSELLESQNIHVLPKQPPGLRRAPRWPFPGTVEVWLPDHCYGERHMLATMHNLSLHGLAMRTRLPISSDTQISLAIHEPALSCYGRAVVRHCTRAAVGYLVGVEFIFSEDDDDTAVADDLDDDETSQP